MPWRDIGDPYGVFVSELMLQQTQVTRVLVKYPQFMSRFPTFAALAHAPLRSVLAAWQGMGYNRRARYLKEAAGIIIDTYGGILPDNPVLLDALPGVGEATAASIAAFAYDKPVAFIETNIRRVFIHHFFRDATAVSDTDVYPLVVKALDARQPRQWYYALMDYGAHLGRRMPNPNRKSKTYAVQPAFEGSDCQVRGRIIRLLLAKPSSYRSIHIQLGVDGKRLRGILAGLMKERMIRLDKLTYHIV